jgi:hypothetical protein
MTIRIARVPGFAVALVGSLVSSLSWHTASGAEQGFYVGANYGQSKSAADKASYDDFAVFVYDVYGFAPAQRNSTFDDKDYGYGFFGGYRMFANLAFEGGYLDLGEVAYSDTSSGTDLITGGPGTWSQKLASRTGGLTLSALGILPLSYRSEIYARAGVMFATNELKIYISDGVGNDNPRISKSSTELLAGVGAGFTFAEIYTARLEYQRVFNAGTRDTGEADIDLISLGVTVTF